MNLEQRLNQQFAAHIESVSESALYLSAPLIQASSVMVEGLLQGSKIISCGNGGSASVAQHFTAKMLNRYLRERSGLPAIALTGAGTTLTAIADTHGFEQVFAKQLEALGQPGDVLLAISTGGSCENIASGIQAARERQLRIILLSGGGSPLGELLREQDVEIRVPSDDSARIQEIHLLAIHCLCDLIDTCLLGG